MTAVILARARLERLVVVVYGTTISVALAFVAKDRFEEALRLMYAGLPFASAVIGELICAFFRSGTSSM